MGKPEGRRCLVGLLCLGFAACSSGSAAPSDADASHDGGPATSAEEAAALCNQVCAVVEEIGCKDIPTQAECVQNCVDWPLPCDVQNRRYLECFVQSGPSAFTCVEEKMAYVLNPGYCEVEGAALDKCVSDNIPFLQSTQPTGAPVSVRVRLGKRSAGGT